MRIFMLGLMALFTVLSNRQAAHATDQKNILVSVPALHSLVSDLMAGVATPDLLFAHADDLNNPHLSNNQKNKIAHADMLVWVGPKYESNLIPLRLSHPELVRKELTLSDNIPLFHKPIAQAARNADYFGDMKFWLDPRLAKMAVRRMSAMLVSQFPDNYEHILDNEIALIAKLKKLESKMHQVLKSNKSVPVNVPKSDVLYLAWRFNLDVPNCAQAAAKLQGFDRTSGPEQYFAMMDDILEDLRVCQLHQV